MPVFFEKTQKRNLDGKYYFSVENPYVIVEREHVDRFSNWSNKCFV
jgi:hypothetical protein